MRGVQKALSRRRATRLAPLAAALSATALAAGFAGAAAAQPKGPAGLGGSTPDAAANTAAGPSSATKSGEALPAGELPIAGYDAAGVRTASAPEAWGGIRTGSEPTLSDRVVRYEITARLDPVKHTVDGEEKLVWRNRSARAIHAVYLHLYLNAFEGTQSTFMREKGAGGFRQLGPDNLEKGEWGYVELRRVQQAGKPVPWSYVHPDGGPETDHTVVRLDLPEAVSPGASTALDISFFDQLPRVVARTGWFGSYHLVGQWFPKIGVLELPGERGATQPRWNCHEFHLHSEFYADFGSFDVRIVAPGAFTVGATGELQGAPAPAAGGLAHHYVQDDVHDFVFTAWDGYAAPLTAQWQGPGTGVVQVKVLYPPEYEAVARPTLAATTEALAYFSETLGPYPYKTVTAVVPPFNAQESGGMEYPTFFTTIGQRDYDRDVAAVDMVTVHEFGHGYFYGLLASNEFEEPFLDEGLNDFWDARMLEASGRSMHPMPRFLRKLGIGRDFGVEWRDLNRALGIPPYADDYLAQNSWKRIGNYGLVYKETATAFHDLEQALGRGVLARAFKEYYRRWHFRHPSTADLREALADASGQRALVERFFEERVLRSTPQDDRVVKLEVEELTPEIGAVERNGKRVERDADAVGKEIAKAREAYAKAHPGASKDGPGPYPFRSTVTVQRRGAYQPQTLVVKFGGGVEKRESWVAEEKWHKFVYELPTKVVSAQLDPDERFSADRSKLDDGRTREAHPLAARRWTLEGGSWMGLALSFLEAL